MRTFLKAQLICATALSALAVASGASAQTADESDEARQNSVTDIIVTAQRRAESIQDVPLSVQVSTAEQLEREGVADLSDLQRVTSSVEIVEANSGERTGGARIRGIGTNTGTNTFTATGSVAIVVDEVSQGALALGQLFDMGQIEVLRGPQGTLFGQTASAGVINVSSVQPKFDEVSGKVDVNFSDKGTLGSEYGMLQVNAGLNMPISETSAIRLATVYEIETGVQRNVYLDKDNEVRNFGLRATYLNELTPTLTVRLQGEYQEQNEDGQHFYAFIKAPDSLAPLLAACGVTITPEAQEYCSEDNSREYYDAWGVNGKIDLDLDFATLTSITSYRERTRTNENTNFEPLVGTPQAGNFRYRDPGKQFTQELRLTSNGASRFNYVVGAFYFKYSVNQEPLSDKLPLGDQATPVGFGVCFRDRPVCVFGPRFDNNEATIESWAGFADVNFDISDTLNLFAGARYTSHKATAGYGQNGPVIRRLKETWNNVSGRAGVRFSPSPDTMFYASVSRGFKGGIIEIPTAALAPIAVIEPEEPLAFELGTKLAFFDNNLAVYASLFHVDHKNFQARRSIFTDAGVVTTVTENIDIKSKGLELDAFGDISDNFRFNLGYTFNIAKYPDGYIGADGLALAGEQVAYAPRHKVVFGGEYHSDIGGGASEFFVNANIVYKSATRLIERSDQPEYVYPGHFTIGGSIGIRPTKRGWTAAIYAHNLFGENEPFAALPVAGGGVRYWTTGSATLREVGLRVGYSF